MKDCGVYWRVHFNTTYKTILGPIFTWSHDSINLKFHNKTYNNSNFDDQDWKLNNPLYHTYHRGGTHYWPIWLDWWHRGRIVCKGSETASRWDPVKGEENQSQRHKCVRIRIKSSKGWWMSYLNLNYLIGCITGRKRLAFIRIKWRSWIVGVSVIRI